MLESRFSALRLSLDWPLAAALATLLLALLLAPFVLMQRLEQRLQSDDDAARP